jgi:hypothetical protein
MNKRHQINPAASRRWIPVAMLALGIAGSAALSSSAAASPIVNKITACGKVITTPGFYQVTKDLTGTSGDCIAVKASNVTIDILNTNSTGNPCQSTVIEGSTISGSVGIHIYSGFKNVFIQGEDSNIAQFDFGIQDDGTGSSGDDFNVADNLTTGLLIDGSSSSFSNFFTGNLLSNTSTPCYDASTVPQEFGAELEGTGSQIFNAIATGNTYGIYETGATGGKISLVDSGGNVDGFFLTGGKGNEVYDDIAGFPPGMFPSNTEDGFFVDSSSESGSRFTDNTAEGNGSSDFDIDGDTTCSDNTYWFNFATNPSETCINTP